MVFKTGDGISIQLILIFKLVKGNLKTKFPHNRAPLHISSNTNKQFRKYITMKVVKVVILWKVLPCSLRLSNEPNEPERFN